MGGGGREEEGEGRGGGGGREEEGRVLLCTKVSYVQTDKKGYLPSSQDRPPGHEDAPRREEWMTELPPDKKPSGIGARKFRTTAFDPGDRSVWTDTPVDRERKAKEEETAGPSSAGKKKKRVQLAPVSSRDREMAEKVEEYNVSQASFLLARVYNIIWHSFSFPCRKTFVLNR